MKKLTEDAKVRLDKYLDQARNSLCKCTSIDADEVESDIKTHIETELEGTDEPVSLKNLEAILDRLGSPTQWVPEEEIAWWRKVILRLRKGPEDWRLAYISFGLLMFAFLAGRQLSYFAGRHTFLLLILASFILARAAIYTAGDTKELGGQRWLLYPSLLIVYIPLAVLVVIWPVIPVTIMAETQTHAFSHPPTYLKFIPNYPGSQFYTFWISAGAAIIGLWWAVLGIFCCFSPKLVRAVLRPFADRFKRRYIIGLISIAVILVLLGGVMAILFAARQGAPFHSTPLLR